MSRKHIRLRQIKILKAKAASLGRDWLTSNEAAEALGIEPKNVHRVKERLKDYIPEIRTSRHRAKPLQGLGMDRVEIAGDPYSLKYYRKVDGPDDGQTTYFIL